MELKEFANLISNNHHYNIKVVISALMDNGSSNANWGKAIANLYKDFPKEIKETPEAKKDLLPTIIRYLSIYGITKDNVDIYYEYDSIIPAKDKDKIKLRNPHWVWEKEPEVVFKNPLDFVRAIPQHSKISPCEYINRYKPQFDNFMKTKRSKVLEHFQKKNIWQLIMRNSYETFSNFCEEYKIDKIEILKQLINSNTRSPLANLGGFKDQSVESFLNDLGKIGKEELFSYSSMKLFNPKASIGIIGDNVLNCLFSIISNKQFDAAIKYMDFFKEELDDVAKIVSFSKTFTNYSDFKELLKIYIASSGVVQKYEAQKVESNNEWFNYLNSYNLMVKLNENLDENMVKSKKMKV